MRMKILILASISMLTSCSSLEPKPEPSAYPDIHLDHQALIGQRLIPRTGYNGFLTNQVCKKFVGKKCMETSILKYDLMDMAVRTQLVNDLKFACKMGKSRWRISINAPAIVRQEKGCVKWKKKTISRKVYCAETGVVKTEFIHIDDYQRLIDGALECRSGF